jgi:hypothetical protein
MPKFTEIVDSKSKIISTDASDPGYPSVAEMQKSQAAGAKGNGLKSKPDETFAGTQSNCADFDSSDSE